MVFGAAVYKNSVPTAILKARLDTAKVLFFAGRIDKIIVSGDNREDDYNEPAVMRAYLEEGGVPEADIINDGLGLDTLDSCRRAKDVSGANKITLITQNYHLPRAIYTCRSVGLDAIGVGADLNYSEYDQLIFEYSTRELISNFKALFELKL